jgi:hypothetical protein
LQYNRITGKKFGRRIAQSFVNLQRRKNWFPMENNLNIESIRSLLSQGDTGRAVQLLIALLEKDTRFKDNLLRTLRVAEANFNAVRQQELKGILSFQEAQREYSKVNDALLAVLDDFEAGRVPAVAVQAVENRRKWLWVGIALTLLVGALVLWLLLRRNADCPKFENDQALHVMILPFDPLTDRVAKPALRIQDDIQVLTQKAGFPAEVKVNVRNAKDRVNSQDAQRLARECGADLVVFGQYQAFENDSIRVRMGFRFLKSGMEFNGPFETFRDITAVQPTRDLKDAVFSLCAMIAIGNKNWPVAKRWMERIREKDNQEMVMTEWLEQQGK